MAKNKDLRSELKLKPPAELTRLLTEAREQLRNLRFRISANQHKDVREFREVRNRIARILTLLHEPKGQAGKVQK